jgi:NADH-quinone oxidoreductase subunit E
MMTTIGVDKVDEIVDKYGGKSNALIQILLEIQHENRWLPKEVLTRVGQRLATPLSQIYQIATFYKAFSLVPKGQHMVSVCMGTACHVRGAPRILDRVQELTSIEPGDTTADLKFTLETVNCLGCCALGPVMVVDGEYHGHLSSGQVKDVLENCD